MILSFSVFKEKILDGTKTQTIRRYSEFQYKRFCNAKKYQLYWGNPRNGGELIREVVPSIVPQIVHFERINDTTLLWPEDLYHGGDILFNDMHGDINTLAQLDGFKDHKEMFTWFYERYGADLLSKKFMVLRWYP